MSLPRTMVSGPIELRMITPRSAGQLLALARDPAATAMVQAPPHHSIDESLELIHDARRLWEHRRAWLPGVFSVETGSLLGTTGISNIDRINARAESGTWLGIPHQGNGFNRYIKAAVAVFSFDVLSLDRLEFLVRVDNDQSLRAMRRLPGLREEGVLAQRIQKDGVAHDAVLFAMLASEFDRSQWPDVQVGTPSVADAG